MLSNLSIWYCGKFERQGDLNDLDKAIQSASKAVVATPRDHPTRHGILNNTSNLFQKRFERLGTLDDLEKAIQASEEVVTGTPTGHVDRPGRLSNMGNQYLRRYRRLGSLDDLERAIKAGQEAVNEIPDDHATRPSLLGNLSCSLSSRFNRLGDLDDLENAIQWSEEALRVVRTLITNHDRASESSNLSDLYFSRYQVLRGPNDLDKAIQASQVAVIATPADHPDRAKVLSSLAVSLHARFLRSRTNPDFEHCLGVYLEAWHCHMSPPSTRIHAARQAANLLASRKRWAEALSILEDAVNILPKVSPRILDRVDQQNKLSEFTLLAAATASIALETGATASHCLGLLEFGRGIIMGLAIDCRSDLQVTELRAQNLDLFHKFDRLRIEIDCPYTNAPAEPEKSTEDQRHRRIQAIGELDQTLANIRQLPGLDAFQLPPTPKSLMAMAVEGPIVIFNCTLVRSDAIIVTSSAIKALKLPKLIYSEVTDWMVQLAGLVRGRQSTYLSRNQKLEQLLLWLWDVAVEPVLDQLKFGAVGKSGSCAVGGGLPHIWWIGVGPLARAPFHAAGDHSRRSTRNTLSRAISSYIPTFKALAYARQKKLELLSSPESRLLLVTMPTTPSVPGTPGTPATPGYSATPGTPAQKWMPLLNVAKEVDEIIDVINQKKNSSTLTRLDRPSSAQVLEKLPAHHAIHFACHGMSDSENPSNSHLALAKDGAIDRLTVGAISNMNIKTAEIAFLSACCTADNPSAKLADESIHIASGFVLAGFSHVLATLWESDDYACRLVAREFYSLLFDTQGHPVVGSGGGHQAVGTAFHYAVRKLRLSGYHLSIQAPNSIVRLMSGHVSMVSMRDVSYEVGAVDCEATRPWCDWLFVLSFVCRQIYPLH